jgi:hypothetical protein
MTPMFRKQDSATSVDEGSKTSEYFNQVSTPSDAITRAKVIKGFVKKMMQGVQMEVMAPSGSKSNVWVCVDEKLTALIVDKDGHKRRIPFHEIDDISVGQEAQGDMSLRIDEDCVTLWIEDGQAITFHFDDADDRDTFADCLSMVMVKQKSTSGLF